MRRLAALLLFSTLLTYAQSAYTISIPAKDEECYFIATPAGSSRGAVLYGNFDLLDDNVSPEPLSVVVLDYEEEHVLFRSRRRVKEGIFQVNLKPDQKVNLCLQNGIVTAGRGRKAPTERKHDGLARTVGFQFTVEPKNEAQEIMSQTDRIISSSRDLTREISNLKNHHEFMRTREAKHREVVEQTFSQLMMWLLWEVVAVVSIAGAQVSEMVAQMA
jgi:emp24/gp25L/p24 family/GOLD